MAKLDLVGRSVTAFDLHTDFSVPDEKFRRLFGKYGEVFLSKDLPIVFADSYLRSRKRHTRYVLVRPFEDGSQYHLHFTYQLDPELPEAKHAQKPEKIFDILSDELGVVDFSVRATFSYPQPQFTSRLQLPVQLTPTAESIFDQIRGMRVTKFTDGDKTKYDVVVDCIPEPRTIFHNLTFTYAGAVVNDSVTGAFSAAVEISESLILRTGV